MKRKKLSFTTRYVLAFGLLLLFANLLLGVVILRQSEAALKTLIRKNMLDVANSAADVLDGDVLGALTEDDVGGEDFNHIAKQLTIFRNNVDIHFIYTVKQSGEDRYTFIVDPDPVDPGAFGEEIVVTNAVVQAAQGIAAVDDAPAADRWGNFYSVYSPVFDSAGNVAGIVGIDFDAEWYDAQVFKHTVSIIIATIASVLFGGVVVFLLTHSVRKRFMALDGELSKLSTSVDALMAGVESKSRASAPGDAAVSGDAGVSVDEIEKLGDKVLAMQREMSAYLDHLHSQAYTDALTNVGNSTAYHERIRKLEDAIAAGNAAFSVAVFDVNNLKQINDNLGHERGDLAITGAAEALVAVFGTGSTYRIGGDEFAVVKDAITDAEMEAVDHAVSAFNAAEVGVSLAISKGAAHYRPGKDPSYREVFARADQEMYRNKKAYYETAGDRRQRR